MPETDFNLMVCRYSRSNGGIERSFFENWLGIKVPDVKVINTVNPSLSLSELVLIRNVAKQKAVLVPDLYERLLPLASTDQTAGLVLEQYSRIVADNAVVSFADEWPYWNDLLPDGEKLKVPDMVQSIPKPRAEVCFTEAQISVL